MKALTGLIAAIFIATACLTAQPRDFNTRVTPEEGVSLHKHPKHPKKGCCKHHHKVCHPERDTL